MNTAPLGPCPPWCVIDHARDAYSDPEDRFHYGPDLLLKPPAGSHPDNDPLPVLRAKLFLPEVPREKDPACIMVDHGDVYGPYAQLDVEKADQMIRDLKAFTARLQQMRDQLAETPKGQA
ncbi:DUF6907 domain-containing protein [Streptomyces fumanus]|uniref:DUF6907 domain-containing protein n=1 Tax=Streptomyces fumanus TaxID=67302 RepID=UPI0033F252AC